MTKRMIDASTWEDDFFISLSFFDRLLWIGILTACADDQGRLQDNPTLIRSKVFPIDDIDQTLIAEGLDIFSNAGKIHRYTADNKKLIQVINWWKHQTPGWAGKSRYSPPEGWLDREKYHGSNKRIIMVNWDTPGGFIEVTNHVTNIVTNPVTNHVERPRDDVNVNDDVNDDGDVEGRKNAPAAYSPDNQALTVFTKVTGMVCFPGNERETRIDQIQALIRGKGAGAAEYMQPFYDEWLKRKYNKSNLAWLDWAVSGEIPTPKPRSNGHGEPDPDAEARRKLYGK